jgi:polar amino acid transport system substrate-binding protein
MLLNLKYMRFLKNYKIITFLAIISLFFNIFAAQGASAQSDTNEVVTIVADVWCPYNCKPESYNPGFMIEIVREIFAKHNIEVQYMNMPWGRAIAEVRKGNYNAIIGAAHNDAVDFVFPKEAQGISKYGMYVRGNDARQYNGINSLQGKIVGVIENYDYGGNFMRYIQRNRGNNTLVQFVSGENALELNMKKLTNKRIDVIVEDQSVMSNALQCLGLQDEIKFVGDLEDISSEAAEVHIAFSPQNSRSAEYAKIVSEGTEGLRNSGRLQEILAKYNVSDWKITKDTNVE